MIVCMSIALPASSDGLCAVEVSNKTMGYRDEMINIDNITLSKFKDERFPGMIYQSLTSEYIFCSTIE